MKGIATVVPSLPNKKGDTPMCRPSLYPTDSAINRNAVFSSILALELSLVNIYCPLLSHQSAEHMKQRFGIESHAINLLPALRQNLRKYGNCAYLRI